MRSRLTGGEKEVEVIKGGKALAKTGNALLLHESGHSPVYYIPIQDIPSEYLVATENETACPYKGLANYYSLKTGNEFIADAVWQYADSTEEFAAILDYVAFYPSSADHIKVD